MASESKVMPRAIRSFFCWLSILFLFGCSPSTHESEGTAATERHVLTFPVTITLKTPNPVSPLAPVLVGSNSVSLGARAEVVTGMTVSMGNGGLQTQPDALLNETWSRGTATLNDRVRVRGTLHARTRTLGNGASVTTWDQNPAFDPPQTLSWQVTYPDGPANDIVLNAGQSSSLEPGKHGSVTLNSQSTLTLRTGTYYLRTLSIQSASVVRLDQANGPVIVYVTDALTLRGSFVPLSGANPDLLIAHLGTTPVFVETPFNGALIAPSASITFRSVTGEHSGYFYAKDPVVDAGAKVKYRAPNAIIGTARPTGSKCRELATAGQIPPSELYKYCKNCEFPLDSDRDGFEDCADGCDFDELKVDEGSCGCGTPDTDTDGDGTPNCHDPCDLDPNNVLPGQCGCLSSDPDIKPPVAAGKRCTESACPQSGTLTCNGAGVCGNRSSCNPGGCRFVEGERGTYWFCPGPSTQAAASTACRNRGMALARIEGFSENEFLQRLVTKPVWIGANSVTTSGTWRWSTPTGNNGDQFWAGGVTGSQRNSLFSFWAKTSPASQRCAVIQPGDARWVDVDCNQALGFICEFRTPFNPPPPPSTGGGPEPVPPMPSTCVTTEESFMPVDTNPMDNDDIELFVPAQEAAENDDFIGPAQNPPPHNSGICAEPLASLTVGLNPDTEQRGCRFDVVPAAADFNCTTDDECTPFGSGLLCRQAREAQCQVRMKPDGTTTTLCSGAGRCGRMECPTIPPVDACDTIDVCDPGSEDDVNTDGNTLVAEPYDPADMFVGGLPVVQPSPAYDDDPHPEEGPHGKNHKWCFMDAQEEIPAANQEADQKVGKANGGSKLSFDFDPNIMFNANVNPLSLGETDLDVRATASLTTTVTLDDFLEQDYTGEILSAIADIHAHRCTISTRDTQFAVFGIDFIDLAGVPLFDTSDRNHDCIIPNSDGSCDGKTRFFPLSERCEQTVGKFITAANRAKKSFRDVQQLVKQYKTLKEAGNNFRNLCQNVIGTLADTGVEVPFFPDGLACPDGEPAEVTINRFLDYYQAPGFGQIAQLRETVKEVADATEEFFNGLKKRIPFGPNPKSESKTIIAANFQIGPVPARLEIEVFYSYGVNGFFDILLRPPFNPFEDVDEDKPQRNPVAAIKAGVAPFASAGMSAFVGAGKALGPFSATLGLEGRVSLATLRAPIFAGAGLGAEVQVDKRSLAPDIAEVVELALDVPTHLNVPKAFKFFVWYEYGASLQIADILTGEINGRLRIKFAFFSRTWKKRLVKFNGLSPITINIISGKVGFDPAVATDTDVVPFETREGDQVAATTQVVQGTTDVGLSESQVPLLKFTELEAPEELPDPDATGEFNPEFVEGMFYDNLCCATAGQQCLPPGEIPKRGGPVPCCPGAICRIDVSQGLGHVCDVDCTPPGESCTTTDQCCTAQDFNTTCEDNQCVRCGRVAETPSGRGAPCTETSECCGFASDPLIACLANECVRTCLPAGSTCSDNSECCTEDLYSCNAQQTCCGRARVTPEPPGSGSPCEQDSDCCGFDTNPTIHCRDTAPGIRECLDEIQ